MLINHITHTKSWSLVVFVIVLIFTILPILIPLHLFSHQQQLRDLDSITFRLTDLTSQINTSLATQNDEIIELDRFLESNRELIYDIAELLSNQGEVLLMM